MEKLNKIYTICGIVGAGLIAWGTVSTIGWVNSNKAKDKSEQEYFKSDQGRVTSYNILVVKHNNLLEQNKAKDVTIADYTKKNAELKNSLNNNNIKYNSQSAELDSALIRLDSITSVLNNTTQQNNFLEDLVENKDINITDLKAGLGNIKNNLLHSEAISSARADTLDVMQNYLNTYMVNRLPIKAKHATNVYLPEGWRLLPTSVDKIKEIKALNKEYKNK